MESNAHHRKRLARVAGALYLVIFVVGPFAFLLGKDSLIVSGDAAATSAKIAASTGLFRLGMTAEAVVFLTEVMLAAVLYALFRSVSRPVSLAAAFARLGEAAVQGVNLLTSILVLTLVGGAGYLTVFEAAERDALAMLFLDANEFLVMVWGLFFGLHLALLGWLIHRSGFMPRIIGWLIGAAALGYLTEGFGNIVAPSASEALAVLVIVMSIPGELALTAWLLIKGVSTDAQRPSGPVAENRRDALVG